VSFTLPLTICGHFIRIPGKIVVGKSLAVEGTFSAPDICAASMPSKFALQWDVTDK
jgi:hypothetical protein